MKARHGTRVTCSRDQTPTSHVDVGALTPRFVPRQHRSGREKNSGPAVLAGLREMIPSRSPMAIRTSVNQRACLRTPSHRDSDCLDSSRCLAQAFKLASNESAC